MSQSPLHRVTLCHASGQDQQVPYKLRIVREAESQRELGAIGALLRRGGRA